MLILLVSLNNNEVVVLMKIGSVKVVEVDNMFVDELFFDDDDEEEFVQRNYRVNIKKVIIISFGFFGFFVCGCGYGFISFNVGGFFFGGCCGGCGECSFC